MTEQSARVFARLLAGELRLYHEEAVITGRRRGDLAQRLEGPLETARRRYLSRFAELDPDASYLRNELRSVLAGGEATLIP